MKVRKRLILIPTYNELENVGKLCREILEINNANCDILFIDDNSPDGTGELLDEITKKNKKVRVIHRSYKKGVGSAHLDGINWAYQHGYGELITMDCDFTHPPSFIPKMLELSKEFDIVVASRYIEKRSLVGWNIYRRVLTLFSHFITKTILGLQYDATGALRYYRLYRIPKNLFKLVKSKTYCFFPESLYILNFNGFKIGEIPIKLSPRTYGHSKMRMKDVLLSIKMILSLYFRTIADRDSLKILKMKKNNTKLSKEIEYWENYWQGDFRHGRRFLYDLTALFYRRVLIRPMFNYFIKKYIKKGSKVLHAGCGGGEVDMDMQKYIKITGMDFSRNALEKYRKTNGDKSDVILGDVRSLPFKNSNFDAVYNLGVMEHFDKKDIRKIIKEFEKVLKPEGYLILFWPPEYGISVIFFKILVYIFKNIFNIKNVKFHPPEISRLKSEKHARSLFKETDFSFVEYYFGIRDLFTYGVIVVQKSPR